jgi:tRNA-dihydrouridine synthase 1
MNIPIISNGNVRVWDDIRDNIMFTGADGVMIGESLLENPWSVTHPLSPGLSTP